MWLHPKVSSTITRHEGHCLNPSRAAAAIKATTAESWGQSPSCAPPLQIVHVRVSHSGHVALSPSMLEGRMKIEQGLLEQ